MAETNRRILSGMRSTNPRLHLGNYEGALRNWVDLQNEGYDLFCMVADLHAHTTIGCKNLVIPWIPKEKRDTDATTTATAAELTILAGRLRELGFRTGFHVHGDDMLPLDSGKTAWQILGENTPDDFIMQYDTANGMSAGADPIEPILAFPGRGITEHLKEWSGEHGAAVIGEGNVPWARVFEACESVAGTEWYIVEHESYEGMTPMESVQRCLDNLRKMGK